MFAAGAITRVEHGPDQRIDFADGGTFWCSGHWSEVARVAARFACAWHSTPSVAEHCAQYDTHEPAYEVELLTGRFKGCRVYYPARVLTQISLLERLAFEAR